MQTLTLCGLLLTCAISTTTADAQCNDFGPAFGSRGVDIGGADSEVLAQIVWDDGNGPALYVAGRFDIAGDATASNIARWDGTQFDTLANARFTYFNSNVTPRVHALAVYDDGNGDALYVGGRFTMVNGVLCNGLAKWNGASWSAPANGVGANAVVHALAAHDDGGGSQLYVGGNFASLGGVAAAHIARWDGATWQNFSNNALNQPVFAFVTHDDGNGQALFIGGELRFMGPKVMKWDGSSVVSVGYAAQNNHCCDIVNTLAVFDDGSGAQIYSGGYFPSIDGLAVSHVARWDGASWSAVAGGSPHTVEALLAHDDGNGSRLYLSSGFGSPLDARVRRLDGGVWTTVGTPSRLGQTLCNFDAGFGTELYLGGEFRALDGVAVDGITRWNGVQWSALASATGRIEAIQALASHDDGSGAAVHADRRASAPDAVERWTGAGWTQLGGDSNGDVTALASIDLGAGSELYAGGTFTDIGGTGANGIARWNGNAWTALANGIAGGLHRVDAIARYDSGSGPVLIAGGDFTNVGGVLAGSLASWNGQAWSTLGGGTNGTVSALATFDSGAGPELYVGGGFTNVSGAVAYAVARWNGSSWSGVGNGANGHVYAFAVFDDGAGPQLYVGGDVNGFGGVNHQNLARWNGAQWSAVPGATLTHVYALQVHDDGSGPALYAGGRGGLMHRWNGTSWTMLGTGVDDDVEALASVITNGGARELWLGGDFVRAGTFASSHIARWSDACPCPRSSYCTAGTTSSGCVPSISGFGTASASASSGFVVRVDNVEGQKSGHLFYGLSGAAANPWSPLSSSYLCVKAPSQRTGTQSSGGSLNACNGVIQLDWNQYVATHPSALGAPFSAGAQVWAQLYFRDPPAPKTTNLSNGLTFTVCP